MTCDICRGGGKINLPVHHEPSVVRSYDEDLPTAPDRASYVRTFDCPQCSDKQPVTKLQVVQELTDLAAYHGDDDDQESYLLSAATHAIADKLTQMRLVKVEHKRDPLRYDLTRYRFSLAVFNPKVLNGVADAVREERIRMANQFKATAARAIRQWACYYTGDEGNISKGQAVSALDSAIRQVLEESE